MSSFAVRVISLSMTNMPKPLGRAKNDVSVLRTIMNAGFNFCFDFRISYSEPLRGYPSAMILSLIDI